MRLLPWEVWKWIHEINLKKIPAVTKETRLPLANAAAWRSLLSSGTSEVFSQSLSPCGVAHIRYTLTHNPVLLYIVIPEGVFVFCICCLYFGCQIKEKNCQDQCQRAYPHVFFQVFNVSGLTFKSSMHFELIFVYGVRWFSFFLSLMVVEFY